ncbi:MAG TPA: hypothetical protein VKS60_20690 [Stellaceae bacterium]|nr:hypothetical protein [Stellaceae bacterium]
MTAQLSVLAQLSATANVSAKVRLADELAALLAQWLAAHGLPAPPWTPDPAWLHLPLPQLRMSAQAMATISALAQLRAQALAQFGLDLLVPAHAAAFARIVATMNARLSAMASFAPPSALLQLAATAQAAAQVTAALQAGLLGPPVPAMTMPAGMPMSAWQAFLNALKSLLPLIAAANQLNLSLNESLHAQLAASLRTLRGIPVPAISPAQLSFMASATATLAASASLQASLGLNPAVAGMAAIRAAVTAKLAAMISLLPSNLRSVMSMPDPLAVLMSMLPKLPVSPGNTATPAVVQAAMSMNAQAVAAMNWQVPGLDAIPILRVGLPTCALTAQAQAALNLNAVLPSPCGSGCDAAKIAKAIAA